MINLFENYGANEQLIVSTLEKSNIEYQTIVLEDDGFVPTNMITPYRFFAKNEEVERKGMFFNEVPIPEYWFIYGDNNSAKVYEGSEERAKIIYEKGVGLRIVKAVEWFDKSGNLVWIDHYDMYGKKFAETLYNKQCKRVMKRYFSYDGKELYSRNFITNGVLLNIDGNQYIFNSYYSFLDYFYNQVNITNKEILVNSLSVPLVSIYNLNPDKKKYVIWQERINEELPGNMQEILKNNDRKFNLLIPDSNEYEKVKALSGNSDKVLKFGYILKTFKEVRKTNQLLILTNSDRINNIQHLVDALEGVTINIVALTEMSPKLSQLGQYKNVKLFPNARPHLIKKLYGVCDIYLDINQGNEIMNAVRMAFDFNLLIFGNDNTLHNKKFINKENVYKEKDINALIKAIEAVLKDESKLKQLVMEQRIASNIVTENEVKQIFNKP